MTELERLQDELTQVDKTALLIHEQEAIAQRRTRIIARQRALVDAKDDVNELEPRVACVTAYLNFALKARQELCEELLSCPPQRDRTTMNRENDLKLSLRNLDFGCDSHNLMVFMGNALAEKMRAAGYKPAPEELSVWSGGYGSIPAAGELLTKLQRRLDAARVILHDAGDTITT